MSRRRSARHSRRPGRKTWLVGLVMGGLVVGVLAWSLDVILSTTLEPDDQGEGSDDAASLAQGSKPSSVEDLLEQCTGSVAEVEQGVETAAPAIRHWATHVQARTDMLEGDISERRMEAIYDRTRSHGHADHDRLAALEEPGDLQPCDELRSGEAGALESRAQDCVARADAASQALTAARNAVNDWTSHLHHMDSFEDGGMSTGRALNLWIEAWRSAPPNISAYHEAVADLEAAPSC